MKRVIRQSVFETNSSSTHSIVYKRKNKEDKILKCSGIRREFNSNLDKLLFVLSLLNHARLDGEKHEKRMENYLLEFFGGEDALRVDLIDTVVSLLDCSIVNIKLRIEDNIYYKQNNKYVEECDGSIKAEYSLDEVKLKLNKYGNMDLYVSILNQINFVDESFGVDLSKYEDFCMNTPHYMGFDIENYKEYLVKEKKFRKILFETYCKVENKTIDDLDKELTKMWSYNENFTCEHLFCDGPLKECYCGFEGYGELFGRLGICGYRSNEEFLKKCYASANKLFSDKYHFILHEH